MKGIYFSLIYDGENYVLALIGTQNRNLAVRGRTIPATLSKMADMLKADSSIIPFKEIPVHRTI